MTLVKPSRLERDVSKWKVRVAKRTKKQAQAKQAANKWRAVSALVKHRDGGKCRVCHVYTGTTGDPRLIGAAHHIVFRSAGGADTPDNLIWTCAECHDLIHRHKITTSGTASKLSLELAEVAR